MTPAAAKIRKWIDEPIRFVIDELKVTKLDPWQEEVLRAFPNPDYQRFAMKACKGPGKTATLSWLSWNFLSTRPDAKVIATSITEDNLADCLWPEMSKWQQKSEYLVTAFEWAKTRITCRESPENWFMSARTWARTADKQKQADALAGAHSDYMMYVLDEAGGIPDSVAATAEAGLASGIETKLIIAGNPTMLEGPLYRACMSKGMGWKTVEITGDPDDKRRSSRVSIKWAREQIAEFGADNPWVQVNVFGRFPPSSLNVLLGPEEVEAAMNRVMLPESYLLRQKRIGVDVAREGDDRTVIFPRQGMRTFAPIVMRNASGPDIASRIAVAKNNWHWEVCCVDDTGGFGASVQDSMLASGLTAIPVNFSGKADDPRYLNRRAEMHFRMAQHVKKGGALPKDSELKRELCAPTYTFTNGKFQIEEKKQIKARLGFSPDKADALCLTFALPELGARMGQQRVTQENARDMAYGRALSDYDPLQEIEKSSIYSEMVPRDLDEDSELPMMDVI